MDRDTYDQLALALLYFMSWKERDDSDHRRTWIGFDFGSLDRLEEMGYLVGRHGNKSKFITPEGIARAMEVIDMIDERLGDDLRETNKSDRED